MTELHIPEPVGSFIEAVNRHDETAFLNAFNIDGIVDDWGRTFTGRDAIKAWSDNEFLGAKGTLTPLTIADDNGVIVVVGDWRSTHANGLSRFEFVLDGERLLSMTIREG